MKTFLEMFDEGYVFTQDQIKTLLQLIITVKKFNNKNEMSKVNSITYDYFHPNLSEESNIVRTIFPLDDRHFAILWIRNGDSISECKFIEEVNPEVETCSRKQK